MELITANTIDGRAFDSWGSYNFVGSNSDEKTHDGFLMFQVSNNPKVKGKAKVKISLLFNDTYKIEIFKIKRDFSTKTIYEQDGIYYDQLVDIIDDVLG